MVAPVPQCQVQPPVGFGFTSIGLASSTNDGTSGHIEFLFNHLDGSFDTSTVTLTPGIAGLQNFSFNEQNLGSVQFFAANTEGDLLQFDNLGATQTFVVPGPIAGTGLPGLILASGGFSAGGDGGRKSPDRDFPAYLCLMRRRLRKGWH
jgi:hypothetical protein